MSMRSTKSSGRRGRGQYDVLYAFGAILIQLQAVGQRSSQAMVPRDCRSHRTYVGSRSQRSTRHLGGCRRTSADRQALSLNFSFSLYYSSLCRTQNAIINTSFSVSFYVITRGSLVIIPIAIFPVRFGFLHLIHSMIVTICPEPFAFSK